MKPATYFKGPTDVSCFGVKLQEICLKASCLKRNVNVNLFISFHLFDIQIILASFRYLATALHVDSLFCHPAPPQKNPQELLSVFTHRLT